MYSKVTKIFSVLAMVSSLSGCGEKPGSGSPQESTETSTSTSTSSGTSTGKASSGAVNKDGTPVVTGDGVVTCAANQPPVPAPTTMRELVETINSLPMPLSLPCFLKALAGPLPLNGTKSTISVQPASGFMNPRIFIMLDPLILGVVPEGTAKTLLELSEMVNETESIKGEIKFPVESKIDLQALFSRLGRNDGSQGTSCAGCHLGESAAQAYGPGAFVSRAFRPSAAALVPFTSLLDLKDGCVTSTAYRCDMIRALFEPESASPQTPRARDKGFPKATPTMF